MFKLVNDVQWANQKARPTRHVISEEENLRAENSIIHITGFYCIKALYVCINAISPVFLTIRSPRYRNILQFHRLQVSKHEPPAFFFDSTVEHLIRTHENTGKYFGKQIY